ncbi:MAG: hypothetical protein KA314_04290 [Chloroflexi bacterium]|nr:hypothetical protein [Chloroflexota bacterium]MBP8055032.1 hypothetical protein [Chloroflexota bacterium]
MWRMMMWLILGVFAAALVACNQANNEPLPCNENGAVFRDDFSEGRNCGWTVYDQGGGKVEIANGLLSISSSQPNQIWWTNPGKDMDDLVLRVQTRQVSGPDDNAFGAICRYQNESNFYVFLISGDGYYVIGKYQTGQPVQYISGNGQFQYSDAINQGTAVNDVEISCIGNQLSLRVNGIALATVTDPTFVRGDIGLGASPLEPGTTIVEFDDVAVTNP